VVATVRAKAQECGALVYLIDNPIFIDAELFVLSTLLVIIALHAIRRNDFDRDIGSAIDSATQNLPTELLAHEENVRLGRVVFIELARDARHEDATEIEVLSDIVHQTAQPGI